LDPAGTLVPPAAKWLGALGAVPFLALSTASAFSGLLSNLWLWLAVGLSAVLQVAVVHVGVLNDAFGTSPLDVESWILAVVLASSVLWVGEAVKIATRRRDGHLGASAVA